MRCSKIKKLLFTDFMDGELDEQTRDMVTDHLKSCGGCRRLEQELKLYARSPFSSAVVEKAPSTLWNRIRSSIESEQMESERYRLWPFPIGRKPLYAAAAIAVIIVVAAVLLLPGRFQHLDRGEVNRYLDEQIEFLSSLRVQDNGGYQETESHYLGTAIEKYLL